MGDLTEHFSRWEFACKCECGFSTVDWETLTILEDLHGWLQKRYPHLDIVINVTSGCRCLDYNEIVQKENDPYYVPFSSRSQHMKGRAVDIQVPGVLPEVIHEYLDKKYPGRYGFKAYITFNHIDSREDCWRVSQLDIAV